MNVLLPHQQMPAGKWRRWALIGDRGSGKTWAANQAALAVAGDVESLGGLIAIVGSTRQDALTKATALRAAPGADFQWRPGPGTLTWANGARGRVFSADRLDVIRGLGPTAFVVADQVDLWPDGEAAWQELEAACRVGRAQLMLTTGRKMMPTWLRKVIASEGTVVTSATTLENRFLPPRCARDLFILEGQEGFG